MESPSFTTEVGESLLIPLKILSPEMHPRVTISVIKKTSKIEVVYVSHYEFFPDMQTRNK
jgi:hypothetical protein